MSHAAAFPQDADGSDRTFGAGARRLELAPVPSGRPAVRVLHLECGDVEGHDVVSPRAVVRRVWKQHAEKREIRAPCFVLKSRHACHWLSATL
jgi:hypothetical protein